MRIEGSTAFITGAASGLGLATYRAFAAARASIVAVDIDRAAAESVAAAIGAGSLGLGVDVCDEGAVTAAINRTREAFGALHIAVNRAGVGTAAKTVSRGAAFPLGIWDRVTGVNLTGTFNVLRPAALAMSENAANPETGERLT